MQINSIYEPYLHNTSRYLHLYGGSGSGKSVFAAQKVLLRVVGEKTHRILCIRKVARTLRSSVVQLLSDQIHQHGIASEFRMHYTGSRFTHLTVTKYFLPDWMM